MVMTITNIPASLERIAEALEIPVTIIHSPYAEQVLTDNIIRLFRDMAADLDAGCGHKVVCDNCSGDLDDKPVCRWCYDNKEEDVAAQEEAEAEWLKKKLAEQEA